MGYWMMDFTEAERQSIGALTLKPTLTQEETELLERWDAARSAHIADIYSLIDAKRAENATLAGNRQTLLSSALSDLQDMADYYTSQYENTIGGNDNEQA